MVAKYFLVNFIYCYNAIFTPCLGGAAITCKNELETINEENLKTVSWQLRQSMIAGSSSGRVLGMDWSKKSGESEISYTLDDFEDHPVVESSPFIVVHGAGRLLILNHEFEVT